MNQKLQKIIEIIQQSEKLDAEQKENLLKAVKDADKELEMTAFKLERTEKVKKTTAILLEETIQELEHKRKAVEDQNRELEIEASLERVRAIAMGMREPTDMLDVCKTISLQLKSLGVKEIRNVQTAIFYENRRTYMNFEFYAKHDKTLITETVYNNNEIHEEFANKMLKGKGEYFFTHIKGKEIKAWIAYQKTTNVFIDTYLETASSLNYYWFSLGPVALGISTYYPLTDEEINLFKRFLKVFELAYQRYLDIEKAEAQAKEAQIEASLERVRAVAMGMNKSEDLLSICEVSFKEFKKLGFDNIRNALIHIQYDKQRYFMDYDFSDLTGGAITKIEYGSHPIVEDYLKQINSAKDAFYAGVIKEDQLKEWKDFRKNSGQMDDPRLENATSLYYYFFSIGIGDIGISTLQPIDESQVKILKRFRNVFDLAYRRYTDISQAEAQAREAQIEASLERVRARSMAMHESRELREIISCVFEELQKLDFVAPACSLIFYQEDKSAEHWFAGFTEGAYPQSYTIPYINIPYYTDLMKAWKDGSEYEEFIMEGQAKVDYAKWLLLETDFKNLPKEFVEGSGMQTPTPLFFSDAYNKYGMLEIIGNESLPEDKVKIVKRMSKVFEQTYTRFLDLQKAEAQAREAQIEAALERVRSRSIGMQKSEELQEVIKLVYEQFVHLKINVDHAGFVIDYKPKGDWHFWIADKQEIPSKITHPYFDSVWANQFDEAKEKRIDFFATNLNLQEKNKFYQDMFKHIPGLPEASKEFYFNCPGLAVSTVLSENVSLYIENFSGIPYTNEENKTLKRFGKVFQQTYTRFLDLQKAEAQARESQIHLALERVRASTMAMHKSEELSETTSVLFQQFVELGVVPNRFFIGTINEEETMFDVWITEWGGEMSSQNFKVNIEEPLQWKKIYKAWKVKDKSLVVDIFGEDLIKWNEYLESIGLSVKDRKSIARLVNTIAIFSNGFIAITTSESTSTYTVQLLERFADVFNLTYRRFLDLQKAETQARESQIEAALERVRAKTMAMHKSDELADTAAVVFQQLINLGIEPNRIYIAIIKDDKRNVVFWITNDDGSKVSTGFEANLNDNRSFKKMLDGWNKKKKSITIDMRGEELQEYFSHLTKLGVPFKGGLSQKRRLQYIAYFSKGFIGIASPDETKPETLQLLERFAAVFNLTYTRFNDLLRAEAQNRIIQAENERKTKELEEARQLQLSLLPRGLPKLPNLDIAVYMKTATEVGGDYYDFNVQGNGTLDIGFGDATGHGLQAGTMITLMKGFFTSDVSRFTPEKFLEHCNSMIRDIKLGRILMSFSHLRFERKRLLISSAGMPPVYYNHKEYNRTEEIMIQGLPLGALQNTSYNLVVKELKRGDTILLLTDGLPEQMNNRKVIFDYSRVLNYFDKIAENTPKEIMTNLVKEAEEWMCGQQQSDDITFVVIKIL